MGDYLNQDHGHHDQKWVYETDNSVVCIACIVETIEDPSISRLKKAPTMAVLSKVIQTLVALKELKSSPTVTCHIIHVVLETLSQTDETSFISSASDVCLKLVQCLESEEIVDFILQDIGSKIGALQNHTEVLPLYVLLGRMVQKFPEVADRILVQYEHLVCSICLSLSFPDEDVQSAAMFILVYIFEGCWEDHLSPRQREQLCEDLVCVLNSAKTQILMMNSLGLLTKVLSSDQWLQFLMSLTVGGATLLSVLKKIVACNVEVVQQLAIQILSNIIERDQQQEYCHKVLQTDLIEFLFEKLNTRNTETIENIFRCLLPLCHMEPFYSRNHSIYGIEVLLKTLQTLKSMSHYGLTKKVLEILSVIFDRQPSKSALFVNSVTMKLCLDVTGSVVDQSHPGVLLAAVKMATNLLKKDHMLRPVPVYDIKTILEKMTEKVQTFVSETEVFEKEKSKVHQISIAYCQAILAAGRLVLDCKKDPSTCLSAFLAPEVEDSKGFTVDSLGDMVVSLISQSAVCLAVTLLEEPSSCTLLFQLLNSLQSLDPMEHKSCVLHLTSEGYLAKAVSIRCSLRDSHLDLHHLDPCLQSWCLILYSQDNHDGVCPGELEIGMNNVTVCLEDLASYLTHSTITRESTYMYSFLLYHCYRNGHMILPSDELLFVLDVFSKEYENLSELSPLTRKLFVFLWAVLTCMMENVVDLPEKGLHTVLRMIESSSPSVWYTHHPAVLHWAFKDSRVVMVCGQPVLQHWLDVIGDGEVDIQDNRDVAELYQLFTEEQFISVLLDSISGMSSRNSKLTVDLMEHYISQLADSDEQGIFLLKLTAIAEERIVQLFLDPSHKPEDMNVECYIQLLIKCEMRNTDDISSSFLKILYHVTSWLDENKTDTVVITCLQLLIGAMVYSPGRVGYLMINNHKFMTLLGNLLTSGNPEMFNVSWNILSLIITNITEVDDKVTKIVELSLNPVESHLHRYQTLTSYLQVVSALLRVNFDCPLVQLKDVGRFPSHNQCPFTSKDFKVLYLYLQQFVLQDVNDVKTMAVQCMEDLLKYLKKYSPTLVSDLMRCSWNKLLFEVLITITASDLSSLNTTLQLLIVILDVDTEGIVFQKGTNLYQHLVDFLSCVDSENTDSQDMLNIIKNKVL